MGDGLFAIDLCAGAGGLTRGLLQAGFEVGIAVEQNSNAATTFRANFPDVDLIQDDLRQVTVETLGRKLSERNKSLGALVAGLPCQGFSESNRKTRKASNPQNHLYREFLRILKGLSPNWFIVENVAGIATLESGAFLERIIRKFRSAGYKIFCDVLSANDFGIPQVRRRTFLVGNRLGLNFEFPKPTVQNSMGETTVRDAIADLPVLRNGSNLDSRPYRVSWKELNGYAKQLRPRDASVVTGNVVSRNSDRVLDRYKHIPRGSNWNSIPKRLMRNYADLEACHTGIYHRLAWNSPSKVIGNFRKNMLVHPSQQRGLSIREAARLQSFPDTQVFLGHLNDRQQQVGDAVPPLLAQAVAVAVLEAGKAANRKPVRKSTKRSFKVSKE